MTKTPPSPRTFAETAETRGPVPIVMGPTRSSMEVRGVGETRRWSESNGNGNRTSSSARPAHAEGGAPAVRDRRITALGSVAGRARSRAGAAWTFARTDSTISRSTDRTWRRTASSAWWRRRRCFFSVGFDASIAMQFHQLRERTPCCADSVTKIVAGTRRARLRGGVRGTEISQAGVLSLRVDGREVAIPPGARTLQFFNIHSSATGIDFFGCDEPSAPEELQEYEPPNIGDGLIEIVATMSAWHLGAIRLGFDTQPQGGAGRVGWRWCCENPSRCRWTAEPWLQPPAVIHVSTRGKIPFVLGKGPTRNVPTMGHVRRPSVVPGGN